MSLSCSKAVNSPLIQTDFDHVSRVSPQFTWHDIFLEKNILNVGSLFINNLNPFRQSTKSGMLFNELVYAHLMTKKHDGSLQMSLIESYKVLDDGHKIYVKIKSDVFFTDNNGKNIAPVKVGDIEATIGLIKKYAKNSELGKRLFYKNKLLLVQKISDYEAYFFMDKINSILFETFAQMPIIARSDIEKIKDYKDFILNWGNKQQLLSSGPYYYSGEQKNIRKLICKSNVLSRNCSFDFDQVNLVQFDNHKTMTKAFIDGQLDICPCLELEDLKHVYKFCEKNPDKARIIDFGFGDNFQILHFNIKNNQFLQDKKNRILLRNAIYNKMRQVSHVGLGFSKIIYNDFDSTETNLTNYYLNLTLLASDSSTHAILSKKIANALSSCGVTVHVKNLPYNMYIQDLYYDKTYDLAIEDFSFDGTAKSMEDLIIHFGLEHFVDSQMDEDEKAEIDNKKINIDNQVIFGSIFYNRKYYFIK